MATCPIRGTRAPFVNAVDAGGAAGVPIDKCTVSLYARSRKAGRVGECSESVSPETGPMTAQGEATLGEALRRCREEQGLSVRTVAKRAGFSASFVSQVELGQASPSIASLGKLARAVGIRLSELFNDLETGAPYVGRKGSRRQLESLWSRARIEVLIPSPVDSRMEAVLITLGPHGKSGKSPESHPDPQFALVLNGQVVLTLDNHEQELTAMDSIVIPTDRPHRWENRSSDPVTILLASSR